MHPVLAQELVTQQMNDRLAEADRARAASHHERKARAWRLVLGYRLLDAGNKLVGPAGRLSPGATGRYRPV
jgi:hypothetical protein